METPIWYVITQIILGIIMLYTYITAYNLRDYIFIPISFILFIIVVITTNILGILLFALGYIITLVYFIIKEFRKVKNEEKRVS